MGIVFVLFALLGVVDKSDFFLAKEGLSYHSNTLVQVVGQTGDNISYIIYKRNSDDVRVPFSFTPTTLSREKFAQQFDSGGNSIKYDKETNDYFVKSKGGNWQKIKVISAELICEPKTPQPNQIKPIEDILSKAPNEAPKPADKVLAEKQQEVLAELKADYDWLLQQDIYGKSWTSASDTEKYKRINSDEKRDAAKLNLLKIIHERKEFQGELGEERASRLIVALTLFGEFRSTPEPAHLYWATETMRRRVGSHKNRFEAVQRMVTTGIGEYNKEAKARIYHKPFGKLWLTKTPAAAALAYHQYSTWNKEERGNLGAILVQPEGEQKAMRKILVFVAEDAAGIWVPTKDNPNINSYVSNIELPEGMVQIETPSVRNRITGQISTADPEAITTGER